MANKIFGKVSGEIEFYGKVDNYNEDGKEYCLCIVNPVFEDYNEEEIKKHYGKKIPNLYKNLFKGEKIERAYFNSSYPVNKVFILEDGELKAIETKNPQLTGLKCKMIMNKTYIGTLLVNEIPEEFQPNPFNIDDFGAIDFD